MIDSLLKALRSNKPYMSSRSIYTVDSNGKVTIYGRYNTIITIKKDWRTEKTIVTKIEPDYNHIFRCDWFKWSIDNNGTRLCIHMKTKEGCYPFILLEI